MLDDYRSAAIDEKLRATLEFLETMTLRPDELRAEHAERVLAKGVSREALRDAAYVAFLFNTLDRLADTLGWEVPSAAMFRRGAKVLLKRGYAIPGS